LTIRADGDRIFFRRKETTDKIRRPISMKTSFIVAGMLLAFALVGAAWGGWTIETVASQGDVGAGCCLAVDQWGRPHISYADKTLETAMFASYNGSSWEFETVASDVNVLGKTSLTFDAAGNPHILFLDAKTGELDYAYLSGANWATERIDGGYGLGEAASALAWPAEPRAGYYKLGYRYAYREGGSWHTELITSKFGGSIELFLDDADRPNAVYSSTGDRSIERAIREDDVWSTDNIAEGIDPDAVLGPDDKIHVSFAGLNNDGLNYVVSTVGGSWKFENVKNVVGTPGYTQICVNVSGEVYISYFNFNKHNLHVMTKRDGVWGHELVATGTYVGNPHSLALGADGYPLLAFYDGGKGDLKLARYGPLVDVELTHFSAERSGAGVEVRWAVTGDKDVAGYNLYRASADAERARVNSSLLTGASPFLYRDADAGNAACRYWLELVSLAGANRTFGPVAVPPAAKASAFALLPNVPNPVARATTFAFELAEGAEVRLAVYDAAGRRVALAAEGYYGPGHHDVPFSCALPPGLYLYRLEAGANVAARKMVVVK
jgi:hypothetical protein